MIAFDKQHLCERLARCIQRRCVIADLLPIRCGCGAGGYTMIADINRAKFAVAMRGEAGVMTKMGNINFCRKRRIHDGLPLRECDVLSVNIDGVSC